MRGWGVGTLEASKKVGSERNFKFLARVRK